MTNEEIWKRQQEYRAHMAAVPAALEAARGATFGFNGEPLGDGEEPGSGLTCAALRTLIAEVERLRAALKQANQDMRDEQREGQYAAGAAYSEGRHEGLREGRGWD
jgi:hypothetical protein